jgi:DNA-directed RNA polymerase specialized sigma24 family protein
MATSCADDLIERPLAGDWSAFEELIAPLMEPAYRLACGMLLHRGEAEDAVQETTLGAWLKLASLRAGAAFRPWFMTIVANRCRDMRRIRWWSVLRGVDNLKPGGEGCWVDPAPVSGNANAIQGTPGPLRSRISTLDSWTG